MDYGETSPPRKMAATRSGHGWYGLVTVYYLALSALLGTCYRHDMNPDRVSYLSLAQKYLEGDFDNAVNGHWAPLISWLVAPVLSLGLEPADAWRLVATLIGGVALVGIDKLMAVIEIKTETRILYLLAMSPVIAWYAQSDVGADMLCASVLLHYVFATIRDEYQHKKSAGIVCGMLGALSYLAKNYNFYFFILHFTCINACYWWQAERSFQKRTIAFNFISAMMVFALLSGVWVGLISTKYHTVTAGTAGSYNFSHIRPGHATTTHPMLTDGFMPPPNATALSAWEDPYFIKLVPWNPFRSGNDFLYYLQHIRGNITKFIGGLAVNYIFDLTIILLVGCHLFAKKTLPGKVRFILLSMLLYPLGYLALYYDGQRYVLVVPILLYIVNAYLVNYFLSKYGKSSMLRTSIAVTLCVSLVGLTVVRVRRDYGTDLQDLNDIYRVSTSIKQSYDMRSVNIASQGGNWYQTIDLAYFLKARYFGKAGDTMTDEQLRRELRDYGIKYYLVFGTLGNRCDLLLPEKMFASLSGDITVYRVAQ